MLESLNVISQQTVTERVLGKPNLSIKNYLFYGGIGHGSYCKVQVVKNKSNNKFYALKYIAKSQTSDRLETIVRERNILSSLNNPFLCNLLYAFQDNSHMYLVLELERGGDLRHYLKTRVLSKAAIRVLMAEIACGIGYIHSNSIVHRDIKPENVLIDVKGHAHIGDFNVATRISPDRPTITRISGTFNYLAPEMHQQVPYTEQVDWWALGVVFYEAVYGCLPFEGSTATEMLQQMYKGPNYTNHGADMGQVTQPCITAIDALLQIQPHNRIKSHFELFHLEFFEGVSRALVIELLTEPSPLNVNQDDLLFFNDKIIRDYKRSNDLVSHSRWKLSDSYKYHGNQCITKLKVCGDAISRKLVKTAHKGTNMSTMAYDRNKFEPYDYENPDTLAGSNFEQKMGNLKIEETKASAMVEHEYPVQDRRLFLNMLKGQS